MNYFIRYDPKTGRINSTGIMATVYIQAEIDAGLPTLITQESITDIYSWSVNLETKDVQNVPPPPLPTLPIVATAPTGPTGTATLVTSAYPSVSPTG